MRSNETCGRFLVVLGLMVVPCLALAETPEGEPNDAAERALGHQVLVGLGMTWTEAGRFQHTIYPGGMLGIDLALGRHVALGLNVDFTYIDERPQGPPPNPTNHRLITGLDFKLLPLATGIVRPWVTLSAAGSVVHDTGYGFGVGAGAYVVPDFPTQFFVDVRRYHFADPERPSFDQTMLRAGVAF